MMRKCVEIYKAWGYDLLCDWFISSIDDTTPPCWTPEHIEELLDGFYVIPKRKEIAATVFDAEPVRHGKWEIETWAYHGSRYESVYCSECKNMADGETPYCPHCGAKMDAENGDE